MNGIDRLIHNELLSRRTVTLPGVGSLGVETGTARIVRGKAEAPSTRIVYSGDSSADGESVIDLITALGVEPETARDSYDRWLASSTKDGTIVIEGVGELSNGTFVADSELLRRLNPANGETVALRRRGRRKKAWIITVAAVLLVVAVRVAIYCFYIIRDRAAVTPKRPVTVNTIRGRRESGEKRESLFKESAAGFTDTESGDVAGSAGGNIGNDGIHASGSNGATAPESPSVHGQLRYHVVAGIFRDESNADKCIEAYRIKYPDIVAGKIPYNNNKWLVSIFSSDDPLQAGKTARMYRIEHRNPDLWVYEADGQ